MTAKLAIFGALAIGFFAGLCGSHLERWKRATGRDPHIDRTPPAKIVAGAGPAAARAQDLAQRPQTKQWSEFVTHWSERDPAGAWAHVWTARSPQWLRDHPEVLFSLLDEWLKRDPGGAQAALLEVPEEFLAAEGSGKGALRSDPFARLLVHLARVDAEGAFVVARAKSGFLVDQTAGFIAELGKESAEAAAALAEKMEAGEAKDNACEMLARVWSRNDPSAALEWAQKSLGSRRYRLLLEASLKRLADHAPQELAQALDDLPPGRHRIDWCARIARTWSQQDAAACLAWARNIPDEVERDVALRSVAERWLEHDSAQAIELARELASPTQQRVVIFRAVERWARQDRSAATAFIHAIADEDTKTECLKLIGTRPRSPGPALPPPPPIKAPSLFDDPIPPEIKIEF